jgi:hypothetical protein
MNSTYKIIFTNWLNVVVIFLFVYTAAFISAIIIDKFTLIHAFYGSAFSILGYGSIFWLGFLIVITVLDILLFGFNKEPVWTNYKLVIEWVVISLPFIYWLIKYNQWIFIVTIIAFFIGQYFRSSYISKILN